MAKLSRADGELLNQLVAEYEKKFKQNVSELMGLQYPDLTIELFQKAIRDNKRIVSFDTPGVLY